jgi:predicted nucleotidyltransferase component of viral defense system
MIPQRNLSLLSNRIAKKGNRRISEDILERDYCLSWFLVGLSYSPLKNILVFKGGTCIKKCYIFDYRFSEDLDFTLKDTEINLEDIQKDLDAAFKYVYSASGIKLNFSHYDRHTHQNTYTFFLRYEGPLPTASKKEVKVDITKKERIIYPLEEKAILKDYKEYEDIPGDVLIYTYSIKEIATEKIVALLDKSRNEPRDLYDIWFLITNKHVNIGELTGAIEEKWKFRGKNLIDVKEEFLCKEKRFKKIWKKRLSAQLIFLPEFEKVFRAVKRELRQAGLLNKV